MRLRPALALVPLILSLSLGGCSFSLEWLDLIRAQRAIARQDYKRGLAIYQRLVESHPDSARALDVARKGSRVAHLEAKNYPLAVEFYRHVILKSPNPEERKTSQKYIAQIQFENLQDYDRSVTEYERLLKLEHGPEEAFHYRLNLAKSHYHLNALEQSLHEIEILLSGKLSVDQVFDAKVLKASVYVANKQFEKAAELWQEILNTYPERSRKENVALNLVVLYEELKEFGKAIEVLEGMRDGYPNPEFLDLRIERLKARQLNQPGAQGWKR
ncbi:MAG: tetratricopeptide repeat protein [Bdellovibrionales bacterium]